MADQKQRHCYDYARPAVTADAVIFKRDGDAVTVLLIKRKNDPYQGLWALPGGFMDMDETTEQAVHREVKEETGLTGLDFTRVDIFDTVDRDPRGRSLTVAYTAFIEAEHAAHAKAGDDAADFAWHPLNDLPELAFDHAKIIAVARDHVNV
jgi:8-oxo-dGTP diphosphatase